MVRLRPFKPQDAQEVARWIGGDERAFMMFTAGRYKFPLKADEIISKHYGFEKDNDAFMVSALDKDGRLSGHFIVRKLDYLRNSAHLGFIIIAPEKRGIGFGSEMVKAAAEFLHESMGMDRITLGVFECNEAAFKCYKNCGFEVKNYIKDCFDYKEEKWGLYEMELSFIKEDDQ